MVVGPRDTKTTPSSAPCGLAGGSRKCATRSTLKPVRRDSGSFKHLVSQYRAPLRAQQGRALQPPACRWRKSYERCTMVQLRKMASAKKVRGRSAMRKADLVYTMVCDSASRVLARSLRAVLQHYAAKRIQLAFLSMRRMFASNKTDPITLESLHKAKRIFKHVCPNGIVVGYDAVSLWDYLMESAHFYDPLTNNPYTDVELKRLDVLLRKQAKGVVWMKQHRAAVLKVRTERQDAMSIVEDELVALTREYIEYAETHGLGDCITLVQCGYVRIINSLTEELFAACIVDGELDATCFLDALSGITGRCTMHLRHSSTRCHHGTAEFLEFVLHGVSASCSGEDIYRTTISQTGEDLIAVLSRD